MDNESQDKNPVVNSDKEKKEKKSWHAPQLLHIDMTATKSGVACNFENVCGVMCS